MSGVQNWGAGVACWAPDDKEAYVQATIARASGDKITVQTEGGEVEVPKAQLLLRADEKRAVADMDDLGGLHVAAVLQNVQNLFNLRAPRGPGQGPTPIYSSVGPVLIAMNPFAELPIYGPEWVEAYHKASGNVALSKTLAPHCYKTVEESYTALRSAKHQAMVICGESGAGKTVTNRKMIDYLCVVAKPSGEGSVKPQAISDANVLLEAFGNAKTTRNENSSRFGKYTELVFRPSSNYDLAGCKVQNFLLERSRVVGPSSQERNYHIFYQLLASDQSGELGLRGKNRDDFKYIKDTATVDGLNDAKEFADTIRQFEQASFPDDEVASIKRIVAAILHLGNVQFSGDTFSSEVDSASQGSLAMACKLLQIEPKELSDAMVHIVAGGVVGTKNLGTAKSAAQKDTLAKFLYSSMFDKIVQTIGKKLAGDALGETAQLGLLDIFGFEDMQINGFEQLFINLANERIQQLFNTIMFKRELEAYASEGIDTASLEFEQGIENEECVKLFTSVNPYGIVKRLAEAEKTPGKDEERDQKFVSAISKTFEKHKSFVVCDFKVVNATIKVKGLVNPAKKTVGDAPNFAIRHYAEQVMYSVMDWVPKNSDNMQDHMAEVFRGSSCPFVASLFSKEERKGKSTVGQKFVAQLGQLADQLDLGGALFVRCIKSNPAKRPGFINRKEVKEQLVNGGVVAALKMRENGLPERMEFSEFVSVNNFAAYVPLPASCQDRRDMDPREKKAAMDTDSRSAREKVESVFAKNFIEAFKAKGCFALGKTKIFLKTSSMSHLRNLESFRITYLTTKWQRHWRNKCARQKLGYIERAWALLQEVQGLVARNGLAGIPAVDDALRNAQDEVAPMKQQLDSLRATHGGDIDTIAAGLPGDKVRSLDHKSAKTAQETVQKVMELKNQADQMFSWKIARCMSAISEHLEEIAKFWADCQSVQGVMRPAELAAAKQAVDEATQRLSVLRDRELAQMKAGGFQGFFINQAGELGVTADTAAPRAEQVMAEAGVLVDKVRQHQQVIASLKNSFEMVAAADVAKLKDTTKRLEQLGAQSMHFVALGMGDVRDAFWRAVDMQAKADELREAAQDAQAFHQAVAECAQAVLAAQQLFQSKAAELRAKEAESSARMEVQNSLNRLYEVVQNMQKEVSMAPKSPDQFKALTTLAGHAEEIGALNYSEKPVEEWKRDVAAVTAKVKRYVGSIMQWLAQAKPSRPAPAPAVHATRVTVDPNLWGKIAKGIPLTPQEVQQSWELFQVLDVNKDGVLSREELAALAPLRR